MGQEKLELKKFITIRRVPDNDQFQFFIRFNTKLKR